MPDTAVVMTTPADWAQRNLKWMARGLFIYLHTEWRGEALEVELTRKSAADYLVALGQGSVMITRDGERLVIKGGQ